MEKVEEFHAAADGPIGIPYSFEELHKRMTLIIEESVELTKAAMNLAAEDYPQEEQRILIQDFLKEMCDVVYVIKGTAVTFGWDFDKAYDLVHKANMTKTPFTYNEDGKVVKGSNYKPCNLEECV